LKNTILVVENPPNWPLNIPDVEIVAARSYLTNPHYSSLRRTRVVNLCRSYRYQSLGYYVSLLAQARGQKPIPSVTTIQDLKTQTLFRAISDDLDELIQRSLAPIKSGEFTLSIYFGRNVAKRHDRLSSSFFRLFEAPLLQARFRRADRWEVRDISLRALSEVPEEHRPFIVQAAREYLAGRRTRAPKKAASRYDLAILWDPRQESHASDDRAVRKFIAAAETLGISAETIERGDYGRLAEFDALFIRDTTGVNHYTYRFARRASAEGLVVIDDPESILKCTNKVYLAELLERHQIATPRTVVVSRGNASAVAERLGVPCILKQPDSSFSQGVLKVENSVELESQLARLLDRSELVIAQEFLPTPFDWRVGIIDRRPIYACRYHMARRHWQIIKRTGEGRSEYGRVDAVSLDDAPSQVVRTAQKAANLIGDGFYGVDLKQIGRRCVVIEVNDNPSVDAGYEDALLKEELYLTIMSVFLKRLDLRKGTGRP
jgi:glutathione synthase/RimK-type ligase-like ATP-grasp enzyme